MRKIIMFNRISIDGFFAGPKGESHEWFVMDPEVDKASREIVGEADIVLFGRNSIEIKYLVVAVTSLVAFVLSILWYSLFLISNICDTGDN